MTDDPDALYTFHIIRPYGNFIFGIVAHSLNDALTVLGICGHKSAVATDCINYTLVDSRVERGIHFYIQIDNPEYTG